MESGPFGFGDPGWRFTSSFWDGQQPLFSGIIPAFMIPVSCGPAQQCLEDLRRLQCRLCCQAEWSDPFFDVYWGMRCGNRLCFCCAVSQFEQIRSRLEEWSDLVVEEIVTFQRQEMDGRLAYGHHTKRIRFIPLLCPVCEGYEEYISLSQADGVVLQTLIQLDRIQKSRSSFAHQPGTTYGPVNWSDQHGMDPAIDRGPIREDSSHLPKSETAENDRTLMMEVLERLMPRPDTVGPVGSAVLRHPVPCPLVSTPELERSKPGWTLNGSENFNESHPCRSAPVDAEQLTSSRGECFLTDRELDKELLQESSDSHACVREKMGIGEIVADTQGSNSEDQKKRDIKTEEKKDNKEKNCAASEEEYTRKTMETPAANEKTRKAEAENLRCGSGEVAGNERTCQNLKPLPRTRAARGTFAASLVSMLNAPRFCTSVRVRHEDTPICRGRGFSELLEVADNKRPHEEPSEALAKDTDVFSVNVLQAERNSSVVSEFESVAKRNKFVEPEPSACVASFREAHTGLSSTGSEDSASTVSPDKLENGGFERAVIVPLTVGHFGPCSPANIEHTANDENWMEDRAPSAMCDEIIASGGSDCGNSFEYRYEAAAESCVENALAVGSYSDDGAGGGISVANSESAYGSEAAHENMEDDMRADESLIKARAISGNGRPSCPTVNSRISRSMVDGKAGYEHCGRGSPENYAFSHSDVVTSTKHGPSGKQDFFRPDLLDEVDIPDLVSCNAALNYRVSCHATEEDQAPAHEIEDSVKFCTEEENNISLDNEEELEIGGSKVSGENCVSLPSAALTSAMAVPAYEEKNSVDHCHSDRTEENIKAEDCGVNKASSADEDSLLESSSNSALSSDTQDWIERYLDL